MIISTANNLETLVLGLFCFTNESYISCLDLPDLICEKIVLLLKESIGTDQHQLDSLLSFAKDQKFLVDCYATNNVRGDINRLAKEPWQTR